MKHFLDIKTWIRFVVKVIVLLIFLCGTLLVLPTIYLNIFSEGKTSTVAQITSKTDANTVLVFGASAPHGVPSNALKQRLDKTIEVYTDAEISDIKILVSGDNREVTYNEPMVMQNYLVSNNVPLDVIFNDFAGRSTYETCFRAKHIFGLEKVIAVSHESHLKRAIFTCEKLGVEVVGVAADVKSSKLTVREVFARVYAVWEIYLGGRQVVLGDQIDMTGTGNTL